MLLRPHTIPIRDQISADESEKGQVEALGVEDVAKLKAQRRLFVLGAVRGVESLLAAEPDATTAVAMEPVDADPALHDLLLLGVLEIFTAIRCGRE
jgi:hypothetical protein